MDCPACRAKLEERTDSKGLVYDRCDACGGTWLDGGELDKMLGSRPDAASLLSPQASDRACPRCVGTMERGGLTSPVLIVDRCPRCHGLWFDRSELSLLRKVLGIGAASEAERGMGARSAPKEPPPELMTTTARVVSPSMLRNKAFVAIGLALAGVGAIAVWLLIRG